MADSRFKIKNGLVVEAGPSEVTGSLNAPNITGSLHGTASFALSSSYTVTASYVGQSLSASYAATASIANYSIIQESQYRFQNTTVIDQDVWLNSGSIVKVVTSSGVSTAEYSLNGGSYTAFTFTGDTWTGNIAVVPKDTLAWRITFNSGFTTGALIVVSNITVS